MTRMMAPDGTLGTVPQDQVEAAIAAGGKVMNPESMREMRQAVFMEHTLFKDRKATERNKAQARRKSLREQMRSKRSKR